jgi:Tol biopolymer transport system component
MKAQRMSRHSCQTLILLVLALLTLTPGAFGQERAQDLYQQALRMERVSGDLEGAIRLYLQVVETGDRTLGARALIRIAESYEKLGRQGAQDAYARIIQDFGDQTEQVAMARERLAALEEAGVPQDTARGGITTRQLHKWVYGEATPLAITPDGKELVYADLWSGNLAIRELTNGQSRNLTQDASWAAWAAAVSPDGRTVSYLEKLRGGQPAMAEPATSSLHLVGIDGSDSRVLYRELGCPVSHHQWTSSGEQIVAVVQCGEDLSVTRISVSDGGTELVTELAPGGLEGISLSPDDRYLTYGLRVEGDGGNFDIWMLALDGSLNVPLVRHPANDRLLGWVPGTDEVFFLSDRDGTEDLWAVRVIDGAPEGPPRVVRRNMGPVESLGFTRDGTFSYSNYKMVYSTGVAPFDLATGTVTMESGVGILGNNMPATWSPDGEHLAFIRPNDPGEPYQRTLRIRHLATGMERELAPHLLARNQRWSPDGRFLLLSGALAGEMEDEDREPGLYLVEVESGQTTQVLKLNAETGSMPFDDLGGEWSKDGTAIIYSLYDTSLREGRLVWLDLESREERELFRDPTLTSQQFAVSPDGSRLVFALKSTAEGYNRAIHSGGRLLFMDLDDGTVRELHHIAEQGRVWSLQWTPDGKHVLYTKGEDHGTAVWRVPVTGGTAERTWTFEEDHFNAYISLSPDGQQVAYTTYHQEFEVWLMENFLSGGGAGGR